MKKILFITWDGPQTNYMEGLFMPIFNKIQLQSRYRFHILQFTWASDKQTNLVAKAAEEFGIQYSKKTILRKPNAILGSVFTVINGIQIIKKYIKNNAIDIVMPRSTMPALMINRLKNRNFKLIFDADGFPLEERVDFAGMSKNSKQYQFLKAEETLTLNNADGVLTRSKKAIGIHQKTIKNSNSEKFSVVTNGRNIDFFSPQLHLKNEVKTELNIPLDAVVFGYCGSLGAKYGLTQIIAIFEKYHQGQKNSYLVLLTGNTAIAKENMPKSIVEYSRIMQVPFLEVPKYLNVFDFSFAIIEPKWSMQGAAAVKVGEYLLMGIPTIASLGIGDTDEILENQKQCFLFNHDDQNAIENSLNFIINCKSINRDEIRNFAIQYFSVEKSAESYLNALKKLE